MRLPNGYGSVTKLSGNRRRPFMVKKTIGYDDKGHPIIDIIGYAETKTKALQILADYNNDPYDVDTAKITLKELYERFKETKGYKELSKSSTDQLKTGFNKSKLLHDIPYKQIKKHHMQDVVDAASSYASQGSRRTFFYHLDRIAMELDITSKQYSQLLTIDKKEIKKKYQIFSKKDITKLWKHVEMKNVDDVLIMIYTGFRISEYIELKRNEVNLEDGTFKGGNKTDAGKNRIVPIHSKILPLVENKMNNPSDRLAYNYSSDPQYNDVYNTSKTFRDHFYVLMKELNMDYKPHDTRHTFRSRLDSAGANKVSIDLMMGHGSADIGERIYTHKSIQELREAIELLD